MGYVYAVPISAKSTRATTIPAATVTLQCSQESDRDDGLNSMLRSRLMNLDASVAVLEASPKAVIQQKFGTFAMNVRGRNFFEPAPLGFGSLNSRKAKIVPSREPTEGFSSAARRLSIRP
jgi:hypothetical protein